jgi:hypothetical protein
MLSPVLARIGRSALGLALGVAASYASGSQYALVLVPLVAALGKWARLHGVNYVPV